MSPLAFTLVVFGWGIVVGIGAHVIWADAGAADAKHDRDAQDGRWRTTP